MKGIILAGGSGTRLYPLTRSLSKHLVPVYDKPMIYYPLSMLMLAGIRDILIITNPGDRPAFTKLLGDGQQWGIKLSYAVQPKPEGIAQALVIAKDFIAKDNVALILGDNIFYGHKLPDMLELAASRKRGATVFAYQVRDPERYGVIEFSVSGKALSIEEKPLKPKSSFAMTGMYFYDHRAPEFAAKLKPSKRGEIEITDLNLRYLRDKSLYVEQMGRGIAWLDTGTHESLMKASQFIQVIEERQGLKVSCPEEIAFRKGYIRAKDLKRLAEPMKNNSYGEYLFRLLGPKE